MSALGRRMFSIVFTDTMQ